MGDLERRRMEAALDHSRQLYVRSQMRYPKEVWLRELRERERKRKHEEGEDRGGKKTDKTIRISIGALAGLIGTVIVWGRWAVGEGVCLPVVASVGAILGALATWYLTVFEEDSDNYWEGPIINLKRTDRVVRMMVAGAIGGGSLVISLPMIAMIAAFVACFP